MKSKVESLKVQKLSVKKDDLVEIIAGAHKGKQGKVVTAYPKRQAVAIEGIGLAKRHIKPSQLNPRGGTKEVHTPIDVSNVKLVEAKKKATKKRGTK